MTDAIKCVKPVEENCSRCTVETCKLSPIREPQPHIPSALIGLLAGLSSMRDAANAKARKIDPSLQPVRYAELCGECVAYQAAIELAKKLAS